MHRTAPSKLIGQLEPSRKPSTKFDQTQKYQRKKEKSQFKNYTNLDKISTQIQPLDSDSEEHRKSTTINYLPKLEMFPTLPYPTQNRENKVDRLYIDCFRKIYNDFLLLSQKRSAKTGLSSHSSANKIRTNWRIECKRVSDQLRAVEEN